jgi:putative ABC transport system permease protein
MIRFIFRGILRDKGRSLMPVLVVSIGVMFTVILHSWIKGIMGDTINMNANFGNGHVKVTTRAFAEESAQLPLDLALLNVNEISKDLRNKFPEMDWVSRIQFGALIDFPDSAGETRAQGPVTGWAFDIFSKDSKETERFNLAQAIVKGNIPQKQGEALISNDFAEKFNIRVGDTFTLFGTTMDGAMALKNFQVSGTVRFGTGAIDKGAMIIDISDAQNAFQMEDAASEILGFFKNGRYNDGIATETALAFNKENEKSDDEFSPKMVTLRQQEGMADLLSVTDMMSAILIFVFVVAMSVVLWNAGLLGSLRRFTEFGVRLALGEAKNHIYKTLIYEGVLIGVIGTISGTIFGLFFAYLLQEKGIDISSMMKNSALLMPAKAKAEITSAAFYIGFIPGLAATVLGNALAGLRIYKRNTATLFKELEV